VSRRFWKYHGHGNDFVLVDHRGLPDIDPAVTRAVCNRHKGIGADGILALIEAPGGGHFMRVFNADGSVADMCGNGLRCFVRWLVDVIEVAPEPMTIGSDAGDQRCIPRLTAGRVQDVSVNLGPPAHRAPLEVSVGTRVWPGHDLFLGNPHFVISRGAASGEAAADGPALATHAAFPHGTNVEWLEVLSPTEANVVIYERGVGVTQACGTGGAGAAAVGVLTETLSVDADLLIHQPGGDLTYRVESTTGDVWMTGPAEPVFVGETSLL